jgi:hypothetical protein
MAFDNPVIQSLLTGFDIRQQLLRNTREQQAIIEHKNQVDRQNEIQDLQLASMMAERGIRPMGVTDEINQATKIQHVPGRDEQGLPNISQVPDDNQYTTFRGGKFVIPGQREQIQRQMQQHAIEADQKMTDYRAQLAALTQSKVGERKEMLNQFGVPVPGLNTPDGAPLRVLPGEGTAAAHLIPQPAPDRDAMRTNLFQQVDQIPGLKPEQNMRLKAAIATKIAMTKPDEKGASDVVTDFVKGQNNTENRQIIINNRAATGASGAQGTAPGSAKEVAAAIIRGEQPPTLTGMYGKSMDVRAELARNKFDLTKAQSDWDAMKKHISTLNGPQQERLRQAISFTTDSLDNIENLYKEWTAKGYNTQFKTLNKATLKAAKQFGGEAGSVAQQLEAQINDLASELGTVYKGGNSSTDESLKLAAENLKGEWNELTFKRALQQVRQNLTIRRNSIMNSQSVTPSGANQYEPKQPEAPKAAGPSVVKRWNPQKGAFE